MRGGRGESRRLSNEATHHGGAYRDGSLHRTRRSLPQILKVKYVTIAMLSDHTGKHVTSIRRVLKTAGVIVETPKGCKGARIAERDANRFLLRHWPEIGAIPVTQLS